MNATVNVNSTCIYDNTINIYEETNKKWEKMSDKNQITWNQHRMSL